MTRSKLLTAALCIALLAGCAAPAATGHRLFRHAAGSVLRSLLVQLADADATPPSITAAPAVTAQKPAAISTPRDQEPVRTCSLQKKEKSVPQASGRENARAFEDSLVQAAHAREQAQALVCAVEIRKTIRAQLSQHRQMRLVINRDGEIVETEEPLLDVPEPVTIPAIPDDGRA